MGYQVSRSLTWEGDVPTMDQAAERIACSWMGITRDDPKFENAAEMVRQMLSGEPDSWQEANEQITNASREWPEVTFTLTEQGENPGDLWKTHYRNGRSVRVQAETVFPEPDWSKLEA